MNNREVYETYENGKKRIRIMFDRDPAIDPRQWDTVTNMVCFHDRYDLGDDHRFNDPNEFRDFREENPDLVIKNLYLYDHSGLTIDTSPFRSRWDSGQLGWIYVDPSELMEHHETEEEAREHAKEAIEAAVEEYDQYVRGNVFLYIAEESETCDECGNTEWKTVDSCGGFIGRDPEENGIKENLPQEFQEMIG